MAKASYLQKGERLDFINSTATDIEAGDILAFGEKRIVVAACPIAVGLKGAVSAEGIFNVPKDTSTAIECGAVVFFDAKKGLVSTDSTGIPAGIAVYAAAATDFYVSVDISAGAAALAAASATPEE